ncbi:TPA: virulence RhuM family protein [Pseudomonas aeruginosa]|nr:virulence RhuM family protein [Pseudomonas aeruginosa]HCF5960134.1 virulence RhuM family protein [Pseudomonas aeruginosa]HCF5986779.1 virulence RhuM family protein [Pseudomonas aeruginosa]
MLKLRQIEPEFLERIVSVYLDFGELQAVRIIPMTMADWAKRLTYSA